MSFLLWNLCLATSGLDLESVPLRVDGHLLIANSIYMDGQGPFAFLIDTGAGSTVISPRLVHRYGWRPTYAVEVEGVGQTRIVPALRAGALRLGRHAFSDVEVLSYDVPGLEADGILGQNVLSMFPFLLDRAGRRLLLDPHHRLAASVPGESVAAETLDGRFIISASAAGTPVRLVIDSGASHLVLFRSIVPAPGTGELAGSFRRALVPTGALDRLDIGRLRLSNIPFAWTPAQRIEDGLLPAALFDSIYFDPRASRIVLHKR